ncbi:MAG: YciI family protein [Acidobacteria bacterium]|nr:YciI family protein [Acidobacteriota bacterium]
MKYLCLVYLEEKKLNALSKSESEVLLEESLAYDDVLRKSGHYVVSDALQPVQTATTVRVQKDKVIVTDGPFAETKEQLGGFILINARDLDDAIQVASKIPVARLGSIEVRPIMELNQQ